MLIRWFLSSIREQTQNTTNWSRRMGWIATLPWCDLKCQILSQWNFDACHQSPMNKWYLLLMINCGSLNKIHTSLSVFSSFSQGKIRFEELTSVIFPSSYWSYQNDFITSSKFLCRSNSVARTTLWPSNAISGQMDKTNINLLISKNLTSNVMHSFAIKKYINQKQKLGRAAML